MFVSSLLVKRITLLLLDNIGLNDYFCKKLNESDMAYKALDIAKKLISRARGDEEFGVQVSLI